MGQINWVCDDTFSKVSNSRTADVRLWSDIYTLHGFKAREGNLFVTQSVNATKTSEREGVRYDKFLTITTS